MTTPCHCPPAPANARREASRATRTDGEQSGELRIEWCEMKNPPAAWTRSDGGGRGETFYRVLARESGSNTLLLLFSGRTVTGILVHFPWGILRAQMHVTEGEHIVERSGPQTHTSEG